MCGGEVAEFSLCCFIPLPLIKGARLSCFVRFCSAVRCGGKGATGVGARWGRRVCGGGFSVSYGGVWKLGNRWGGTSLFLIEGGVAGDGGVGG